MKEEVKVELPLVLVEEISKLLEGLIEEQVVSRSTFKSKFISEDGKVVKNPTPKQIEDKKLNKIFDFERTILNPNIEQSITELGIKYAKLNYFLTSYIRKEGLTKKD